MAVVLPRLFRYTLLLVKRSHISPAQRGGGERERERETERESFQEYSPMMSLSELSGTSSCTHIPHIYLITCAKTEIGSRMRARETDRRPETETESETETER